MISGYDHLQTTGNDQGGRNFMWEVASQPQFQRFHLCSEVVDYILGKMNTGLYVVSLSLNSLSILHKRQA